MADISVIFRPLVEDPPVDPPKNVQDAIEHVGSSLNYVESLLRNWIDTTLAYLPRVALALLLLALFIFFSSTSKRIINFIYKKTHSKTSYQVIHLLTTVLQVFFITSGIILALRVLKLMTVITSLLAGAGIVGIIAGFAFKDVASNIFASLLLHVQSPFKKSDWISVSDSYGMVTKVGWLMTNIYTPEGIDVFVPNYLFFSGSFINYSNNNTRRVIMKTGVSYGDDLDKVKKLALEEASKLEELLPRSEVEFFFTEIGGYSYNFILRFWIHFTDNVDYLHAMSDIIMRIKKRFEEADINIAYPVTTLDFGVKGGIQLFDKEIEVRGPNDVVVRNQPTTPVEKPTTSETPAAPH